MPSVVAASVLCVVMREPRVRPLDTTHPGCWFFDVYKTQAQWRGRTVDLPCGEYTGECYRKKLVVLFSEMLKEPTDSFYYVEADHTKCASFKLINKLATAYLSQPAELITTSTGASGWLFTRRWATTYLASLQSCTRWCYCVDCIAALVALPRATTRVLLTQHSVGSKRGLNTNDKHLPRCYERRVESGMNGFDFFDHARCGGNDISPCSSNFDLFLGH